MKKRYANRGELSIIIRNKMEELKQSLERVNGKNYPKKIDYRGWELYGKIQALAWVLVMYVDGKCFDRWLKQMIATADNAHTTTEKISMTER